MRFALLIIPAARNDLAEAWLKASDRTAVSQAAAAPTLRIAGIVHNAVELPAAPPSSGHERYMIEVARITPEAVLALAVVVLPFLVASSAAQPAPAAARGLIGDWMGMWKSASRWRKKSAGACAFPMTRRCKSLRWWTITCALAMPPA